MINIVNLQWEVWVLNADDDNEKLLKILNIGNNNLY